MLNLSNFLSFYFRFSWKQARSTRNFNTSTEWS